MKKNLVMHTWLTVYFISIFYGFGADLDLANLRRGAGAGQVLEQAILAHQYYQGGLLARDPEGAWKWAGQAAGQQHPVGAMIQGLLLRDGDGRFPDAAAAADAFRRSWSGGLRKLADDGDPLSATYCGIALLQGCGIDIDVPAATRCFKIGSDGGIGAASRELAILMLTDRSRGSSLTETADLMRRAADSGDAQALYLLAGFQSDGIGTNQDAKRAERTMRKAAEQGSPAAQLHLARQALTGSPKAGDYVTAEGWYRRAALQGNVESQEELAWLLFNGSTGRRDVTDAAGWFGAAARAGSQRSQLQFARMLLEGLGRPMDAEGAASWYRQAADAGNREAKFMMAWLYFQGRGVSEDRQLALTWLRQAAEAGHPLACFSLGSMLDGGEAGVRDPVAAQKWYEAAAIAGIPQAQYNLALLLESQKDNTRAAAWYTLAVENGILSAEEHRRALNVPESELARAVKQIRSSLAPVDADQSLLPAEASAFIGYSRAASGFVADNGLIVTGSRIAESARAGDQVRSLRIHFSATDSRLASIVAIDSINGLTILKAQGSRPPLALSARDSRPTDGMRVAGAGFVSPNRISLGPDFAGGTARAYADDPRLLQLDFPVAPAQAGGPLLDERGLLVGILISPEGVVTGNSAATPGYAIRMPYAAALLGLSEDQIQHRPGHEMDFEGLKKWAAGAVVLITAD